jgi:Tol biopolymer transport system component
MNSDGSNVRRLTNSSADDRHPAWSPGGAMLVFASTSFKDREIVIMNDDATGLRRLTSAAGDDEHPHWTWTPWAVITP